MRYLCFALLLVLVADLLPRHSAVGQDRTTTDLFGRQLRDWSRLGSGKNPWRITAEQTLICDKAHDVYVADETFRDGTLRLEYRFTPTGEKAGYNAAVSVRRWGENPGCKIALGDDCGAFSITYIGGSDREKKLDVPPADRYARRIGAWNAVEIKMAGRSVEVIINGKSVTSFDYCEERGLIGLHAEGSEVEFRAMTWKGATK